MSVDIHTETGKQIIDAASFITVVGTIMDALPSVAALFTIVWTAIRIWESDTVQDFVNPKGKQ